MKIEHTISYREMQEIIDSGRKIIDVLREQGMKLNDDLSSADYNYITYYHDYYNRRTFTWTDENENNYATCAAKPPTNWSREREDREEAREVETRRLRDEQREIERIQERQERQKQLITIIESLNNEAFYGENEAIGGIIEQMFSLISALYEHQRHIHENEPKQQEIEIHGVPPKPRLVRIEE